MPIGGVGSHIAILEPLDPDADQISRQLVALRQAMKRLASEKLLCDLTLELDTVGAVFGHGLSSFESSAAQSIAKLNPVRLLGPTPSEGHFSTPKHRRQHSAI